MSISQRMNSLHTHPLHERNSMLCILKIVDRWIPMRQTQTASMSVGIQDAPVRDFGCVNERH
eukprot:6175288-Amphidinium_carterae.1